MRWRYLTLVGFFLLSFFAISAKLFYWQIIEGQSLSALAQSQYGQVVTLTPQRGEIETSDSFPIAANRLSYLVFANPKEIKNPSETAQLLSPILKVDSASISALLSLNKFWVSLKPDATAQQRSDVTHLDLPGIGFQETYTRFYPEASMAAQLLGFVGKDENGNSQGYFGIEGYYDRQLRGRPGYATQIHDALGHPILSQINTDSGEEDGRTLVLTVNRAMQYLVEQKLKDAIQKYGADSGMVGVMDPKTGGILAMSSYPSFDQRDYSSFDTSLYKNPFITNTYEPGSTFKPLIMSSAFDSGLLKPDSICPICGGPVQVANYLIQTWNDKHFPNENMMDIIKNSDNDGMIYVSQVLGRDKMLSYINNFGMGQVTGIDLEGEVAPYLPDKSYWQPIDLATASFGQGISVTPIEILDAFSAIANDGVRMQPHVISQIITPEGQTIPIDPKILSQPISPEAAKVMTQILVYTVDKGEASFARLKGYRIAGKTGTASVAVAGHYDSSQTIASFVGFAPADNPKFVMLVILNHPTASIYGSETAAPVFFDIAQSLLNYYGIGPTPGLE
ncbi:MAG TPA: penicillin-binding protein 2 [Patescibacteria group bacterium]|nr:penicillin-binding protein 2 [Patescibacteria group bacterium]